MCVENFQNFKVKKKELIALGLRKCLVIKNFEHISSLSQIFRIGKIPLTTVQIFLQTVKPCQNTSNIWLLQKGKLI